MGVRWVSDGCQMRVRWVSDGELCPVTMRAAVKVRIRVRVRGTLGRTGPEEGHMAIYGYNTWSYDHIWVYHILGSAPD